MCTIWNTQTLRKPFLHVAHNALIVGWSKSYRTEHLQLRTGGFCWCKVLLPHALADGNQRIRIRTKMMEFSSAVSSTLSLYLILQQYQIAFSALTLLVGHQEEHLACEIK